MFVSGIETAKEDEVSIATCHLISFLKNSHFNA